MPLITPSSTRCRKDEFEPLERRRDRFREHDRDRERDRDRDRAPERFRYDEDDVQKERVDELIRLLQKKPKRRERDSERDVTDDYDDYDRKRRIDEDKLDRAAEAIECNKGNYYANTRKLWELDNEVSQFIRDPEQKRILNEKMRRTIQYYLDTFLFSKTSDPMEHLEDFCAKYKFVK